MISIQIIQLFLIGIPLKISQLSDFTIVGRILWFVNFSRTHLGITKCDGMTLWMST